MQTKKKEVILMYSGGLDSILSCIRLINEGYKVYLLHFDNGSCIGTENIQIGAQILKERYKEYDAIFIEIEKVGYGNNNLENKMRKRRANFYENLGFCKMMFDLNLYKIIYSAYILTCSNNVLKEEVVIENIFEIYKSILGEKKVEKNCKVLF